MLISPVPFTGGPTVVRSTQRLFIKHFLSNILLLRQQIVGYGVGTLSIRKAFIADHTFITTRGPYKNKTTRNQYLVRRFGYQVTARLLLNPETLTFGANALGRLAELKALVGALDFAHASVAFSSTSLLTVCDLADTTLSSKNGRLALPVYKK